MGTHFPAKCAKTARGVFRNERLGTLNRLNYFEAETHPAEQNRPWVPHAGGQDDGSLHKLPQIIPPHRGAGMNDCVSRVCVIII